ncbi:unnamed protein product [Citrullus colocynthis]|uniref:Uncharacterized protein n=1 Tax=Citrullus colocynthis TaxID=252529 RepID=A0ABP0XUL7_9ROSI
MTDDQREQLKGKAIEDFGYTVEDLSKGQKATFSQSGDITQACSLVKYVNLLNLHTFRLRKFCIYKALSDFPVPPLQLPKTLSFWKGVQSIWHQLGRPLESFPEGSRAAGRFSARKRRLLRMSTSRKLNKKNWRSLHARDLNQKKRQEGQ